MECHSFHQSIRVNKCIFQSVDHTTSCFGSGKFPHKILQNDREDICFHSEFLEEKNE